MFQSNCLPNMMMHKGEILKIHTVMVVSCDGGGEEGLTVIKK